MPAWESCYSLYPIIKYYHEILGSLRSLIDLELYDFEVKLGRIFGVYNIGSIIGVELSIRQKSVLSSCFCRARNSSAECPEMTQKMTQNKKIKKNGVLRMVRVWCQNIKKKVIFEEKNKKKKGFGIEKTIAGC